MSTSISIRLPDKTAKGLSDLAYFLDRSKTYVVKKAVEEYLRESADYMISLERLRDKDDEILSSNELRKNIGL